MASEGTADLASVRASAMKVAQQLIDKGQKADAIEVLTVWASAANDAEGHKLLAEALRHDAASPLAKAAFAKMEGISGDDSMLEAARQKWNAAEIAKKEKEGRKPVGGWQAEVGYNNNVKYKDQVFHIQTEDSGVKRPHIITHLFADGGRILKSYKRTYASLINNVDDLSSHVRAWMKGQHKEMYIALREGRFDGIIEGREHGAMDTLEGPPNPDLKKGQAAAAAKAGGPVSEAKPEARASMPSAPEARPAVVTGADTPRPPVQQTRARLHVIRALGDGPILHEVRNDTAVIGKDGDVVIVGDKFTSPRHASLSFRGGKLEIEDVGSLNGTFLRIRQPVELEFGDVFIAGDQLLRLERNPPPNDGPDSSPTYFYSSPKWPTTFRVAQLWEAGCPGLCVVARGSALQVGRSGSDLNFPQDFWLNDAHCLVEDQGGDQQKGFFMLTDLGSRGGTFVKVRGPTRLNTGDEILIGRTRLRVELLNQPKLAS
jgi:pSer/pThr/pTyr-binding forkhead associated (FHA) protein